MLVPSKPSWNFCVQLQDSISLFKHHFHINAASWLSAEHLIQWQQPSSQIFPDSLWTILSKAYPQKNGTLLHGILQATGVPIPHNISRGSLDHWETTFVHHYLSLSLSLSSTSLSYYSTLLELPYILGHGPRPYTPTQLIYLHTY